MLSATSISIEPVGLAAPVFSSIHSEEPPIAKMAAWPFKPPKWPSVRSRARNDDPACRLISPQFAPVVERVPPIVAPKNSAEADCVRRTS